MENNPEAIDGQPQAGLQEPQDKLFFNVMPKAKANGPMVNSTIESEPHTNPTQAETKRGILRIIAIAIIIAACGVAGYYGFTAWQKQKDKPAAEPTLFPPATEPTDNGQTQVTTSKEWLLKYFNNESCVSLDVCGDIADPDKDGLINKEEEQHNTDPNNPDSDSDSLADGDEVHVFAGSPANPRTANNEQYTDADDAKGGVDSNKNGERMSAEKIQEIANNIKQYGLHEPSLSALSGFLDKYQAVDTSVENLPENPTGQEGNVDKSPEARLSRDTERLGTVRKLGIALFKYYTDAGYYPVSENFSEMMAKIKPYNPVATNPTDPLNTSPYVYTYTPTEGGKDFTLTYQSETQNQLIKYTATNAAKDAQSQGASLNDDQRTRDLETLRQAMLIYSAANTAGSQTYVFPTEAKFKTDLAPQYLQEIPKDPKTGKDYEYKVSSTFDSFTLKAALENPPSGKTGYQCTQDACDNY